ncbi:MAG: hypothetical protein L0K60_11740 [Tetragenococcus koreensis]|nr:hypothetical protein [Tetragenococcus koreensis]MDN6541051.1 hypothetical protein [Tetragenococcus koreensis]
MMETQLQPIRLRGRIINISDRDVKIELPGRMGIVMLPKRSIICDNIPNLQDKVEIYLSYAQVVNE